MAKHFVKIGVADLSTPMRFAFNSRLVVAGLAAIAVTTSSFTACAQDLPNPQPIARAVASTGAPAGAGRPVFSRTVENHRLFFGFLEFDWDPNAPGGVPGFGPLPDPTHVANR